MKSDEKYMHRCIDLAGKALGSTAPNPLVGAVIVYREKIISEGFHQVFGGQHAEANAIRKIQDKTILSKSTLYVNLEPCAHKGKTPPCAELIVQCRIPEVIVGTADPNSLVSGKGISYLRAAGVKVKTGLCLDSCIDLNRRFFTHHILKRPYIILKWAETTDGFIDVVRKPGENTGINWISNETSRLLVHKWRSEEQAIMIGTNTARMDNPKLNTRHWHGINPLRIIIDKELTLPENLNIFDQTVHTLILNNIKENGRNKYLEYVKINSGQDFLSNLNLLLYERGIQSMIIEGGKKLLESYIQLNLWDEARVFVGQKEFYSGLKAPETGINPVEKINIENDFLLIYRNFNSNFNVIKDKITQIGLE